MDADTDLNLSDLKLLPREQEQIVLNMPTSVLASLREVARSRDLSLTALVKFYVGKGLRQDLSQQWNERISEENSAPPVPS